MSLRHPHYLNGNLYLSGGMEHAANEGAGWRAQLATKLRALGYFPFDISELDAAYACKHGKIYNNYPKTEEGLLRRKANLRRHFVDTDLNLIKNDTDALIVYYDESARRGAGTISECQYAYLLDVPIFIVCDWVNWMEEMPGWLHALSTKVFTSFEDLLEYLEKLPPGILKRDVYGNRHSPNDEYLCSLSGEPFKKSKHHFVSTVSPLYSKQAVEIVKEVTEDTKDRYEFFVEHITDLIEQEKDKGYPIILNPGTFIIDNDAREDLGHQAAIKLLKWDFAPQGAMNEAGYPEYIQGKRVMWLCTPGNDWDPMTNATHLQMLLTELMKVYKCGVSINVYQNTYSATITKNYEVGQSLDNERVRLNGTSVQEAILRAIVTFVHTQEKKEK